VLFGMRDPAPLDYEGLREAGINRLVDAVEECLNLERLESLLSLKPLGRTG